MPGAAHSASAFSRRRHIGPLSVVARPDSTLVAVAADDTCDVFTITDAMARAGWYVQPQLSFRGGRPTIHLTLSAATAPLVGQFLDALRAAVDAAVAQGPVVVPSDVASGLVSEIRLRKQTDAPALTPREQEILHLIAAGKSLPQIAKELYLGLTTVKTHVQHLYEKLGVSDRAAAVASAMRRGLIE